MKKEELQKLSKEEQIKAWKEILNITSKMFGTNAFSTCFARNKLRELRGE